MKTKVHNAVFAQRLYELRKKSGYPAYLLSELCGMSHCMVGLYEKGKSMPGARALDALAQALGVSTDYLLGRENLEEMTT